MPDGDLVFADEHNRKELSRAATSRRLASDLPWASDLAIASPARDRARGGVCVLMPASLPRAPAWEKGRGLRRSTRRAEHPAERRGHSFSREEVSLRFPAGDVRPGSLIDWVVGALEPRG